MAATERGELSTPRLHLEPVAPAHAPGHFAAIEASRSELLPWMPWAVNPTLDGVGQALADFHEEWDRDREFHFSFFEESELVGAGGINRTSLAGEAEIHYWMRSDRTGQGLATEACRAMLGFAFGELDVREVILLAGEANLPSLRVAEKLGFVYERTTPDGLEGSDGPFPTRHHRLHVPDSLPSPPTQGHVT